MIKKIKLLLLVLTQVVAFNSFSQTNYYSAQQLDGWWCWVGSEMNGIAGPIEILPDTDNQRM
jgi:hypothetical protein